MVNESMKRVSINRLSMEPSRIIKAILEPDYPHAHLEWNVTGEGIEITPMDRQCVVEPIDFDGDSAKATVTATIPDSPSFVGTSASCDVTVVKQPTAIQLSAVGAPGGYMVTVVQSSESYSRLWKLDAGDVYQGDVCDESGGWQPLPADGIIDAQAGVLTVVDVDAESKAKRAGSCTLAPSNNLAYYGPVDGKATITSDGALHFDGTMTAWQRVSWDVPGDVFARIKGKTVLITKQESNSTRFGIDVAGGAEQGYTCITQSELSRQVPVPADAESAKIVVEAPSDPVTSPYDYHVGMYVDVEEAPAWKPGIIVGGGVLVETPNLWPTMQSTTVNGVTFAVDGHRVTINGTATDYAKIDVAVTFDPGTYVLRDTGNPNVYLQVRYGDTVINAAEQPFTIDTQTAATVQLVCRSGASFDNVTVTPYLHALSGGGVTDSVNLWPAMAGASNAGITFTGLGSGSYRAQGTATGWASIGGSYSLKAGTYLLTGPVTGCDQLNVYAQVQHESGGQIGNTSKKPLEFTLESDETVKLYVIVRMGDTVDATITPGLYALTPGGGLMATSSQDSA